LKRVLVVLATYNESENLPRLVAALAAQANPALDLLVIDDNSPDGTGRVADDLSHTYPQLTVIHRPGKLGLASAVITGLIKGRDLDCHCVVTMDSDFSHDPADVPALIAAMDKADVAVGSRYVHGGAVEGWGLFRQSSSIAINAYARILLHVRPRDCSGAFRCYSRTALARIPLDNIRPRGYAFAEELLFWSTKAALRIQEVPIRFVNRAEGKSKLTARVTLETLWSLFDLFLRARSRPLP